MKKILCTLAVGIICCSAYPLKLGLEFRATDDASWEVSTIGVNLGITDQFELKPQLGFRLGDSPRMNLILDGNFYLPDISSLRHYAGFGLHISVWDNEENNDSDNSDFYLNGHYGLRYDINDVISLFGEIGLNFIFDPFMMVTTRPGLGVTFYFPNFN
jgi:hypothetical protein